VTLLLNIILCELKMLFLKLRNLAPGSWLLCSLLGSVTFGLRYDYGDGTYYVGNVDNDGKPNGRGQFYNSSGSLGKLLLLLLLLLLLWCIAMIAEQETLYITQLTFVCSANCAFFTEVYFKQVVYSIYSPPSFP